MYNFRKKLTTRKVTITLYFYQPIKMIPFNSSYSLLQRAAAADQGVLHETPSQSSKCIPNKRAPKLRLSQKLCFNPKKVSQVFFGFVVCSERLKIF